MTMPFNVKADLLNQRYGQQQKPKNFHWTPEIVTMMSHRSVRAFLPKPLAEGVIETMVAAAQSASSSGALHQWSVIAVTDPALKQRLADTIAPTVPTDRIPWIEEAAAVLVWVADLSRSEAIVKEQGGDPVVLDYLDSFLMPSIDAALAAQNAAIAAESLGLGLVFLGVMRNAAKEISDMLNLPSRSFVTFGMAVGHPDTERPSAIRPRPALPVVLHENTYDREGYRDFLPAYEEAFFKFRTELGMKTKTWQNAVYAATTSMEYMGGREKLRETVIERGFKLL